MKLENEKSFRFFHFPSHRQRVNTTREHVNGCVNIFLLKKGNKLEKFNKLSNKKENTLLTQAFLLLHSLDMEFFKESFYLMLSFSAFFRSS